MCFARERPRPFGREVLPGGRLRTPTRPADSSIYNLYLPPVDLFHLFDEETTALGLSTYEYTTTVGQQYEKPTYYEYEYIDLYVLIALCLRITYLPEVLYFISFR